MAVYLQIMLCCKGSGQAITCVCVCALQGHLASNGMAPFPKNKIPVLLSNVAQAEALIAQGK